ncbi:hypothetical protein RRG08_066938 [Elysia crispata]|uniref:Uncharacterized protein n=1 Tax=Elysia crispata TaxID=231223 RepID=A0AAE1ANT5_9GAST|nr:hypothetical protein RRG08_066938 [Elysia crispata]
MKKQEQLELSSSLAKILINLLQTNPLEPLKHHFPTISHIQMNQCGPPMTTDFPRRAEIMEAQLRDGSRKKHSELRPLCSSPSLQSAAPVSVSRDGHRVMSSILPSDDGRETSLERRVWRVTPHNNGSRGSRSLTEMLSDEAWASSKGLMSNNEATALVNWPEWRSNSADQHLSEGQVDRPREEVTKRKCWDPGRSEFISASGQSHGDWRTWEEVQVLELEFLGTAKALSVISSPRHSCSTVHCPPQTVLHESSENLSTKPEV